uniref:Aminotransferase class I/classII large domain-containing protein n=1 Tax=Glossina pallidipes TaxID=7398 RepID=A0A1A9ZS53_GLOPL
MLLKSQISGGGLSSTEIEKMLPICSWLHWDIYNNEVVNLSIGAPDLLENCCKIFKKATEHRLKIEKENNCRPLFQRSPSGTYEARSTVANYFGKMYKSIAIFVDGITYMIDLDVISQFHGLKIISVPLNSDGIDLKQLEDFLKSNHFKSKNKEFWGVYYTTPTFHNLTGILFSDNVCQILIKFARKYDFLITCDDVYNVLHYQDEKPPIRLFVYDHCNDEDSKEHVISNASFPKIIGPGIRLGWIALSYRMKAVLDNR